jgi:hypothetical protein
MSSAITRQDIDRWRWMAGVGACLDPAAVLRLLDALDAAWDQNDLERIGRPHENAAARLQEIEADARASEACLSCDALAAKERLAQCVADLGAAECDRGWLADRLAGMLWSAPDERARPGHWLDAAAAARGGGAVEPDRAGNVTVLLSAVRGRCCACASAVRMDGDYFAPCRADRECGPNDPSGCPGWAFSAANAAEAVRADAVRRQDRRRPEGGGA